jgi:hypothetical protein
VAFLNQINFFCHTNLFFVGLSPDFSLFGFLDQVVPKIRMGDGDQLESRALGVLRSVSLIILPRMLGIPPMPSWMQSPSFRCSRTLAAISLPPSGRGVFFGREDRRHGGGSQGNPGVEQR